jgi:hypothetical protein
LAASASNSLPIAETYSVPQYQNYLKRGTSVFDDIVPAQIFDFLGQIPGYSAPLKSYRMPIDKFIE